MKIIQKERQNGKTNDIFWLAVENQPSLIVTCNAFSANILNKKIKKLFPENDNRPDIEIMIFSDFCKNRGYFIGNHYRQILIDDLDICLERMIGQRVEFASITSKICDRAMENDPFWNY